MIDRPHLLIVDDDERIRTLLKQFLQRNGFAVTVARDAEHADKLLQGLSFDLIVLDVMMPGEDGISFAKRLRQWLDVPILLLTARAETSDRIHGLEAGADDYLGKPFEPKELLLRINAILRRNTGEPNADSAPAPLRFGDRTYEVLTGAFTGPDGPIRLTTTEVFLMKLFAAHPGEVVSRTQIKDALAKEGTEVQERAIDVQVTRLRRKIEPDVKEPRFLQTVRGEGYRLMPG